MRESSKSDIPTMYYCEIIEREFRGGNYVPIGLYYGNQRLKIPYDQIISEYGTLTDAARRHTENRIDGMFFWNEVVQLYNLFASGNRSVLLFTKTEFPIRSIYEPPHGLPVFTKLDRGEGTLVVKEGFLSFSVGYDYDMFAFELSSRNHDKFREMFEAGRAEFLAGSNPRKDFWEDEKFKLN